MLTNEYKLPNKMFPIRTVLISLFFIINCTAIAFGAIYFFKYGYLPAPFYYDKSDTFMDLFNPLYWAYNDGRYTEWKSVYPPLNFLFLRLLDFVFGGASYVFAPYMREHSPFIIGVVVAIYLTIPAMVLKMQYGKDFSVTEKFFLYFVIIFSPPMLFALERGNLILLAPILLAFAVSRRGLKRSTCIAVLINIKAYLLLLLIFYLIKRNWRDLLICICMAGVIFVVSGWLIDPNYYLFFTNIINFSNGGGMFSLREVMSMPSSISAYAYVLKNPSAFALLSAHMSAATVSYLVVALEVVKLSCLTASLAIVSIKASAIRDVEILALLVVVVSNLGIWVGGYTMILYIVLIPIFLKMHLKWVFLGLVALIYLPLDLIPLMKESIGTQYSYLSNAYVSVDWTLGFGSFVRPLLNLALLLTMSWEFVSRMPIRKRVPSLPMV